MKHESQTAVSSIYCAQGPGIQFRGKAASAAINHIRSAFHGSTPKEVLLIRANQDVIEPIAVDIPGAGDGNAAPLKKIAAVHDKAPAAIPPAGCRQGCQFDFRSESLQPAEYYVALPGLRDKRGTR